MSPWKLVSGVSALGIALVVTLLLPWVGEYSSIVISDLGQLGAAAWATWACARTARRSSGSRRISWWCLSAGCGSWTLGQSVWTGYEVFLDRAVPFPSAADVGFLGFPLAAGLGLLVWLSLRSADLLARGRDVLDGVVIAGSLLTLSWVAVLADIVDGGGSLLNLTLSLAYPVGDVVLGTLVLLAAIRATGSDRVALAVLAVGLGGLALSDSAYVYLVNRGSYSSADLVSGGWVLGFLLVGAAAVLGARAAAAPAGIALPAPEAHELAPSPAGAAVPALLFVAAGATLVVSVWPSADSVHTELMIGMALLTAALGRQVLALADYRRLLAALHAARRQLEQQALHDPLTGLANRALLADRLDRALARPGTDVGVLFCDLDDFKQVNDQFGHAGGDVALRHVARALLGCVRATDTVARLGGDEFVILLEDSGDVAGVAERVVSCLRDPLEVDGRPLQLSLSVGVVHYPAASPQGGERRRSTRSRPHEDGRAGRDDLGRRQHAAGLLLLQADAAMYAAKDAGKGRYVLAPPGPVAPSD